MIVELVLDTHPLVFHLWDPRSLGPKARRELADPDNRFLVPSMALLELQYLIEIGKVECRLGDAIRFIEQSENFRIVSFAESELLDAAAEPGTRDPFDRTILATARCRSVPIVTRDRWMRSVYPRTVW